MGKNSYVVESDFDDLHGNPDDGSDLELDLDSKNPIVQAALSDEDWTPPDNDDKDDKGDKPDDDEKDDDLDDLEELEDDDDSESDDDDEGDEDEDDEDDSEDDDSEDDRQKNSKNVQKRIDREIALRRQAEARADQRIAKMERRLELRDAKDDFREDQVAAESKLQKLRKRKVEALEEGESEKVVDIDDQILDIKADRKAAQLELKRREKEIDSDDSAPAGTPEEGRRWIEKYPQFHTNKQFNLVALQADKMCAARGLDKTTPEYYEEMEKILAPQFPEIVKLATKTTKREKNKKNAKKKRSAVGSTTKAGTRRKAATKRGRRVITLTKTDQANMVIFGMDPHDPEQVKHWAASKIQD